MKNENKIMFYSEKSLCEKRKKNIPACFNNDCSQDFCEYEP